ncbi:MAG: glycosyltransferase family 2 protein [Vicinamibacterales bacterium]
MVSHPRVAVVIPAFNEADTIRAAIRRVPYPPDNVIVADNGSSDGTGVLAARAGAHAVRVSRRGYGRACLAGISAAGDVDLFVFLDADLSENPEEMSRLIEPIVRDEADLVLGVRVGRGRPWHARTGTALCVWLINRLWRTHYTDLGPFRAIRATALRALQMRDQTWGWTIEMQVKAAESGLRCREVEGASGPRAAGRSKISGSVIGTMRAAGRMLETIVRLRLTRSHRSKVRYCSGRTAA